jgi:hypothetical protein
MDNQLNELSRGGKPAATQTVITSGLRRKKESLMFLIIPLEQRSSPKMWWILAKRR